MDTGLAGLASIDQLAAAEELAVALAPVHEWAKEDSSPWHSRLATLPKVSFALHPQIHSWPCLPELLLEEQAVVVAEVLALSRVAASQAQEALVEPSDLRFADALAACQAQILSGPLVAVAPVERAALAALDAFRVVLAAWALLVAMAALAVVAMAAWTAESLAASVALADLELEAEPVAATQARSLAAVLQTRGYVLEAALELLATPSRKMGCLRNQEPYLVSQEKQVAHTPTPH